MYLNWTFDIHCYSNVDLWGTIVFVIFHILFSLLWSMIYQLGFVSSRLIEAINTVPEFHNITMSKFKA